MASAQLMDRLEMLARTMIMRASMWVEHGEDVVPVFVAIPPKGDPQIQVVEGCDSDERQAAKERFVRETRAIAVVMVSDAWTLDKDTGARKGEMLTATIETHEGATVVLWSEYTRTPLNFQPIQRTDVALTAGDTFGHTNVH